MKFKVGDKVKLKKGTCWIRPAGVPYHRVARIKAFILSTAPGAVALDRSLMGNEYWNTSDLTKVKDNDGSR